jgi:hypothetical protein
MTSRMLAALSALAVSCRGEESALPVAPREHAVLLRHPADGGAVRAGGRVVVDAAVSVNGTWYAGALPPGAQLCLRLASTRAWACTADVSEVSFVAEAAAAAGGAAPSASLHAALFVGADGGSPAAAEAAAARGAAPAARAAARFAVDAADACAGRLGEAGCGRLPAPHCTSLPRFRFFLYEQASAPTAQAAELYYALRDSPLRTAVGDPAAGEACVYIAVADVYAANVEVGERSRARLQRRRVVANGGAAAIARGRARPPRPRPPPRADAVALRGLARLHAAAVLERDGRRSSYLQLWRLRRVPRRHARAARAAAHPPHSTTLPPTRAPPPRRRAAL